MIQKKLIGLVWTQFLQRKLRSSLTIVGIIIGITSLVSLIILSSALQDGITSQLDSFGTDSILIAPLAAVGGGGGPQGFGVFTDSDVRVLEQVQGVSRVNALLSTTIDVRVGRETRRSTLRAPGFISREDLASFLNVELVEGRFLDPQERNVIVGYRFAKEQFDRELFVGSSLFLNDRRFTIVGIIEEQGTRETDLAIFTHLETGRQIVGDSSALTAVDVRVAPGFDFELVRDRIEETLKRSRGQEDFGITTADELREQIGSFLVAINIVVLSIALISLFVASLGIINSLYTSVFQRTKEIGTMKAIGATNQQILFIFVLESAIIGLIGGILGVFIGYLFGGGFIVAVNSFGFVRLPFSIDWVLVFGSIFFSVILGIVSGLLPAYRASKLKPVDALRHD